MRSLVLFGVLCVAAVKAGNYIPVYGEQYIRPGLQYPYVNIPSTSYRHYPYGVLPQHGLPLAGAPVSGVATVAPTVSALPLAPGAPGGSVIFSGTGDVSAVGTGVGFFAGRGEVDLAGQFPAGVFVTADGRAQFDGAGQIQVSTVPGVGAVGSFRDFTGFSELQGTGAVATAGTGSFISRGTGVGGVFGEFNANVNGVGQTLVNTQRGGRSYNVPAVPAYGSVYPSHRYSTYGSLYNGGHFPGSYGTYRLIRPAPVAGTYGTTYGPVYGNKYAPRYYY